MHAARHERNCHVRVGTQCTQQSSCLKRTKTYCVDARSRPHLLKAAAIVDLGEGSSVHGCMTTLDDVGGGDFEYTARQLLLSFVFMSPPTSLHACSRRWSSVERPRTEYLSSAGSTAWLHVSRHRRRRTRLCTLTAACFTSACELSACAAQVPPHRQAHGLCSLVQLHRDSRACDILEQPRPRG